MPIWYKILTFFLLEGIKIINTLNETHLHRTLKSIYALGIPGSKMEAPVGDYIADILAPDGSITEIQTGSLSNLSKKIAGLIADGRKIRVVYPLATEKYIETRTLDGKTRRRKSPTKKNIYSIFRELTGLCGILLDKKFYLEVPEIIMTEERTETEDAVQSKNGRRRFKKNWTKTGKRLEELKNTHVFHGKKPYVSLIPSGLDEIFTFTDFFTEIKKKEPHVKTDEARLALWCLCHMGIVVRGEKKGRSYTYSLN